MDNKNQGKKDAKRTPQNDFLVVVIIIVIIGACGGFNFIKDFFGGFFGLKYSTVEYVDNQLNSVYSAADFKDMDLEEKKELCKSKLDELEKDNYIKDISYNPKCSSYEFKYKNGNPGIAMLEPFNKLYEGASKYEYAIYENNIEYVNEVNNKVDIGNKYKKYIDEHMSAKIMYGLGEPDAYDVLLKKVDLWNSEYLATSIDDYCTVEDFMTGLAGYDFIDISEHGYFYEEKNTPTICIDETVTEENYKKYSKDINKGNVFAGKCEDGKLRYFIMPSFFEEHYKKKELDGAIVYVGCCSGYKNDKLVSAIHNAGASGVIGSSDTVYIWYNLNMEDAFVYSLLSGDTVAQALDFAKSVWGYDDMVWAEKYIGDYIEDDKPTAKTMLFCGGDVKLIDLGYDFTVKPKVPEPVQEPVVETKKEEEFNNNDYQISTGQAEKEFDLMHKGAREFYWGIYPTDYNIYNTNDIYQYPDTGMEYVRVPNMNYYQTIFTEKGFKQYMDYIGVRIYNGEYYVPFINRGSDITYKGYYDINIKSMNGNRMEALITEYYDDRTETNKMVLVNVDGNWIVDEFILPD